VHFMHAIENEYLKPAIKIESRITPHPFQVSLSRLGVILRYDKDINNSSDSQDSSNDSSSLSSLSTGLKKLEIPSPVLKQSASPPLLSSRPAVPNDLHNDFMTIPDLTKLSNAPSSPVIALHPTDVPMAERLYRPEYDYTEGTARPRIGQIIALDIRTLHPVSGYETLTVPDAYIRYATVLTGIFEPYIFPDVVHNTPSGPYDLPPIRCSNWGERVDAMITCRATACGVIHRVETSMTPSQLMEMRRPSITVFITRENGTLAETTLNRAFFFEKLHPIHNPFLSSNEATFLRGACYHFRRLQQNVLAEAIDVLLRSPQYDMVYCRRLRELGLLDTDVIYNRQRALDYIKVIEDRIILEDEQDARARDLGSDGEDEKDSDMAVEDWMYEPLGSRST
jgi:hypothetical protein